MRLSLHSVRYFLVAPMVKQSLETPFFAMRAQHAAAPLLSCSRKFASRTGRAFTLVEFLVVISVVVILTSLLMPALSQARRAGDRLRCLNNMRQIGAGLITYADDSNNRIPQSSYINVPNGTTPQLNDSMCLTTKVSNGEARPDGLGLLLPDPLAPGYGPPPGPRPKFPRNYWRGFRGSLLLLFSKSRSSVGS